MTFVTTFQVTLQKVANLFCTSSGDQCSSHSLISLSADVRTQAMYQMMDQGFVGLIFSCFIEDKNTKVGNLKMAINPPSTHEKYQPQGKAEILGCSLQERLSSAWSTVRAWLE